ncbi:type IV toxin-antitoxin system AbiEi family antitoxin domain-containing protein [Nocardioides dongkuii]|uniref:type IV toxin-antitoxin system AbiEi family antitoxin domain-containing protein n=1 Tax=Nocardioides dongkuii TaxID=2760089 RepID=UPI0015FAC51A|nr:type IV toxin-antitoxin system AbiEi family antitoxin domain-containing protein [Nocardioides dongkuii]
MTIPLPDDFPFRPDEPFTRAQALEAGLSDRRLGQLTKQHVLRRPIRNVYVGAATPDSLALRCRSLGLVVPSDGFVCDLTAAWVHAGEKALPPGAHERVPPVSFFRPSGGRRLRNVLTESGERRVEPRDLVEMHGLVLTTPLRTALDGGRLQRGPDMRLWTMSCMLAQGSFTLPELCSELGRFARQRGIVLQRELVARVDAGFQSFGEAALANRWWDAALPRPHTQVEVVRDCGSSYFIDLGLPGDLFGGEYDGDEFHSTDDQRAHDRGRRDWLRHHRSWRIEVFTATNTFGYRQDAERVLRDAWDSHRRIRYL